MQFLAIMKISPEISKEQVESFNVAETVKTWEMYKSDALRTIWFIPNKPIPSGTVALLECADQEEAESLCREFPFIINKIAGLEVIPLAPGTFYEMLFDPKKSS